MNSRSSQPAAAARSESVELPLASPAGLILLAWLVPGLGHFLLGLRLRGLAFAGLVLGSLAFGAGLDGHMPWELSGSPLFILATLGAMGSGVAYFVLHLFGFTGDPTAWGYDYGGAFILSAGLMNLLLLLDVHDICWGKELADAADPATGAPASGDGESGDGKGGDGSANAEATT